MKSTFFWDDPDKLEADLFAIPVFEGKVSDSKDVQRIDKQLDGLLSRVVEQEEFVGKAGETVLLHTHGRLPVGRVLLVGLGKRDEFDVSDTRRYGAAVVDCARRTHVKRVATALPPLDSSATERVSQFLVEGVLLAAYRYDRHLSPERRQPLRLEQLQLVLAADFRGNPAQLALSRAEIVGEAVCFARDLANDPPGELTPSKLAEVASALARDERLECKVLGPKECERQKMRLFLAVAQGSVEEPRFLHLTYHPRGKEKPAQRFVLVGKGVTFDSGGLSLKPTASMVGMKADMAGAAAVLAVMNALPKLGLRCEVHALVAATENMISGSAYKIGDIVTGLAGKSVEVVNTDAEGRLTLADALAYGVRLKPDEIIDIATLTGAVVVALGPHMAGVMGSDVSVVERFLAAGRRAGEEVWPLPLPRRLHEQIESPVADLKNAGERWGGASTAGLFLKAFVEDVPWIHFDIAGPAFAEKDWSFIPQGGTGFGVATLIEYLVSRDSLRS
ncbi:MAG: leucyl aminopeptidase [Proteobacteria bacterium]|jgi:leucyl aminopeptidase|nr:leucyl aminopeptidase [Pseudomonadota bacterium]